MKTKKQEDSCKSAENLKVDKKKAKPSGEKSMDGSAKSKHTTRVRTIKEMFASKENLIAATKPESKDKPSKQNSPKTDAKPENDTKAEAAESPTAAKTKTKENKKPKKDNGEKPKRPAKTMGKSTKGDTKKTQAKKEASVSINSEIEDQFQDTPMDTEIPVGEGCTLGSVIKLDFQSGISPSARWGHSLTMIDESTAVLVGGQGDKLQLSKDSCLILDISRHCWRNPDTSVEQGQKPEARMGHTAVYDPVVRCLYLFGGSKNKRWFNDVNVLDVDDMSWKVVKANGKAPTRAYHTATLYRNELWIFGGVFPQPDPQPDGCSNDIHVYSPVEMSWYMPIMMGDKPAARSGHSATLLQDRIVVFGGWDYPVVHNDLHILDLTLVEWSQPKVNGTPPAPRSWHASSALHGNRVLIHGGYDGNIALQDSFIFNLDTLTWTSIIIPNNVIARCGHTACCLPYKYDKDNKDDVIIFGGGDNDGAYFGDLLGLRVPIDG